MAQIEQIIYEAILLVLRDGILGKYFLPITIPILLLFYLDFYEEILTLIDTLTINTISPLMWQVFYVIKEAFFRDAADYFAGK
jgi:hypothetical protein